MMFLGHLLAEEQAMYKQQLQIIFCNVYIYIYIYVSICVCVRQSQEITVLCI